MNKKIIIIGVIILIVILLFPIRMQLKDGGSIQYKSLIYEITKVHSFIPKERTEESINEKSYKEGYIVKLLGVEIYNKVK